LNFTYAFKISNVTSKIVVGFTLCGPPCISWYFRVLYSSRLDAKDFTAICLC